MEEQKRGRIEVVMQEEANNTELKSANVACANSKSAAGRIFNSVVRKLAKNCANDVCIACKPGSPEIGPGRVSGIDFICTCAPDTKNVYHLYHAPLL